MFAVFFNTAANQTATVCTAAASSCMNTVIELDTAILAVSVLLCSLLFSFILTGSRNMGQNLMTVAIG